MEIIQFRKFLDNLQEEIISIPPSIIPTVTKKSVIRLIDIKNNPISIYLVDGTKLSLTYHEFKRIKGKEPQKGRMMIVVFQRNPTDTTPLPSKIQSITVE